MTITGDLIECPEDLLLPIVYVLKDDEDNPLYIGSSAYGILGMVPPTGVAAMCRSVEFYSCVNEQTARVLAQKIRRQRPAMFENVPYRRRRKGELTPIAKRATPLVKRAPAAPVQAKIIKGLDPRHPPTTEQNNPHGLTHWYIQLCQQWREAGDSEDIIERGILAFRMEQEAQAKGISLAQYIQQQQRD